MLRVGYVTGKDCGVVTTDAVGIDRQSHEVQSWPVGRDGAGYDSTCDCYCWGYTPPGLVVHGLGASGALGNWRICTPGSTGYTRACQDCQPPAAAPATPPPSLTTQQQQGAEVWGISLGWLIAGAVVAGGGYYAYKKGVFKKKGRRK